MRPQPGTSARGFNARPRVRRARRSSLPPLAWRLLSAVGIGGWTGLALFHAWLFWGQWQDGRLADPVVAAKWGGSILLLGALAMLHRSGRALVFGRHALIVWTLVAIVHVGASQSGSLTAPSTTSSDILFVLPGVAALLTAGAAVIAGARRGRQSRCRVRAVAASTRRRPRCTPLFLASPRSLRAPPSAIA